MPKQQIPYLQQVFQEYNESDTELPDYMQEVYPPPDPQHYCNVLGVGSRCLDSFESDRAT